MHVILGDFACNGSAEDEDIKWGVRVGDRHAAKGREWDSNSQPLNNNYTYILGIDRYVFFRADADY